MTDQPEARRSARVDKPWGHEEIFAQVEGSYVGKTLHVNGGESLSLQWHHEKDETIAVLSGQVEIDLGLSEDTLRAVTVAPGESVRIPPGLLHRVRALTDSVLVEASTAAPGWQEDIVRLDDRYGRTRHPSTLNTQLGRNRMNVRRTLVVLASLVTSLTVALVGLPTGQSKPAVAADDAPPALTNLAHLDWLGDTVDPPDEDEPLHTTYRLAEEPEIGVLWTYAEPRNGVLTRVGGGIYDPATDTYTQGAFNADDVSRAAVVYIRHWVATGSPSSRDAAYEMLRGLTYLQTASGDDAGNVVLWMQPDGTLNPSAEPVELPDPSDSDASYWVARTIWALGEGYAAFAATDDPADDSLRRVPPRAAGALHRRRRPAGARHLRPAGVGRRQAHPRRG